MSLASPSPSWIFTTKATGIIRFLAICLSVSGIAIASSEEEVRQRANLRQQSEIYGTQCSFSITGPSLDGCNGIDLHHRQKFYDDFMSSCHRQFSKRDCDEEEKDRHKMNRNQPQSMVNMTSTGYRKIKAPPALIKLLSDFWETNKQHKVEEEWGFGNIFTNHWEAPTYMVSVEDENLEGAGAELKKAVWDAAIDGIAEWTGGVAKLRPVSLTAFASTRREPF